MAQNLFYFLAFVSVLSALLVVFSRNPIHSVLFLILCFFSLSGHYIMMNAQFIAVVNIIVYAGAIMVLFLFTIMFLNFRNELEQTKTLLLKISASVFGGMIFIILVSAFKQVEISQAKLLDSNIQIGLVENLGKELFSTFLIPFELVSVLFLSAMVGAVLLGRREKGERNF